MESKFSPPEPQWHPEEASLNAGLAFIDLARHQEKEAIKKTELESALKASLKPKSYESQLESALKASLKPKSYESQLESALKASLKPKWQDRRTMKKHWKMSEKEQILLAMQNSLQDD